MIFLKVGNPGRETPVEKDLRALEADLTVVTFQGDYYNLPDLVPRLATGGEQGLLEEVLACPLYTRADLDRLPPGYDWETCEIL